MKLIKMQAFAMARSRLIFLRISSRVSTAPPLVKGADTRAGPVVFLLPSRLCLCLSQAVEGLLDVSLGTWCVLELRVEDATTWKGSLQ